MEFDAPIGTVNQVPTSSTLISEEIEYRHNTGIPIVSPTFGGRRRSTAKMPGILKRAVSTPNVRSVASSENLSMSAADKKRNKLGYHRTAVACGHCRRRKIRCIPAYDESANRCQNCIRLKKECHFYPVDQQIPGPGKRTRSSSKADVYGNEGEASVSSSSPGVLGSSSVEQIDQVNGQINTPPLPQEGAAFHNYPAGGPVGRPGYMQAREFDYHQGHEVTAHALNHHYPIQSPHVYTNERVQFAGQHHYGHPHDPQILPGSFPTSPYSSTPVSGTLTNTPQDNSFQFPQQSPVSEFQWAPQPPVRSMSMADSDDLQQTYSQYRPGIYPVFGRRMNTAPEIPQMASMNASLMSMTPENQHTPTTAAPNYHNATSPYQQMHTHGQPMWSVGTTHSQQVPILPTEAYPQHWGYPPDMSGLAGVREEEMHGHVLSHNSHQAQFHAHPG